MPFAVTSQRRKIIRCERMFLERTNYFAKAGAVHQVIELRREASAVRMSLGLPAGRIYVKQGIESDGPDVTWECSYESPDAYRQDLAMRAASEAFEAVRERMGDCIEVFERHFLANDSATDDARSCQVAMTEIPLAPRPIEFESNGQRLTGYLYLPPGDGPFPCVITNHGSLITQGTTDLCRPGTASVLMSWGLASFLPHRHGYGESPGMPWSKEVDAKFGSEEYDRKIVSRLDRESDDVIAAAEMVSGLAEIDAERIAVMGSSFGGTVTLFAASKWDRFRCAVEFAGAAINWQHTPALRQAMITAAQHAQCPIYFIQAANDYCVEPTRVLGETPNYAGHHVQSRVFPQHGLTADEGHFFERSGALIWGPSVRQFFERWLMPRCE